MKKTKIFQFQNDFIVCIIILIILSSLSIISFYGYFSNENNHDLRILLSAIFLAFMSIIFVFVTLERILIINIDSNNIQVNSLLSKISIDWKNVEDVYILLFDNVPKVVTCKNVYGLEVRLNIPNSFNREWIVISPINNAEFLNIGNYFIKMNKKGFIRIKNNQKIQTYIKRYYGKEFIEKVIKDY